jgi:hypothetical protein
MTKAKPTFTERAIGLTAALFGVLIGFGALHAGAGLPDAAGGAFLGYVAAVVLLPMKIQADRIRVVLSTTRTVLIAAVITGIVFIGFARAFKGLV